MDNLSKINELLFHAGDRGSLMEDLQQKISVKKEELRTLFTQLHTVRNMASAGYIITEQQLYRFDRNWPTARLTVDESNSITLSSVGHCYLFHYRNNTLNGNNGDVIYVTLPMYGMKFSFCRDGRLSVKRCHGRMPEFISQTILDIGVPVYMQTANDHGHLHCTNINRSGAVGNICYGNNQFADLWNYVSKNPNADDVLMVFHRAMMWAVHGNISDTYGTYLLWNDIELPEFINSPDALRDSEVLFRAVQRNLASREPVCIDDLSEGDNSVRNIVYSIYDYSADGFAHQLVYHFAWALWLYRHTEVSNYLHHTVVEALKSDLLFFLFYDRCNREIAKHILLQSDYDNRAERLYKCPAELRTYFEHININAEELEQINLNIM